MKGHTGFVNAVAALKATPEFPEGLIVTGSQDKTINIYFPSKLFGTFPSKLISVRPML